MKAPTFSLRACKTRRYPRRSREYQDLVYSIFKCAGLSRCSWMYVYNVFYFRSAQITYQTTAACLRFACDHFRSCTTFDSLSHLTPAHAPHVWHLPRCLYIRWSTLLPLWSVIRVHFVVKCRQSRASCVSETHVWTHTRVWFDIRVLIVVLREIYIL